ncbi:MAG: 4-(cytidine 5'-diphospho)-2-C-methyl-D-erythritol kinase [Bacteroidota bacterium]
MISFPNAKLNLGLHVVEKRTDSFHNIETIFYPISLCDILEIIPDGQEGVEFTISGLPVPGEAGANLVLKAVNLTSDAGYDPTPGPSPTREGSKLSKPVAWFDRHIGPSPTREGSKPPLGGLGVHPDIRIHLHKIIPTGSGLGGGSSDGAHAIRLLNDLWELGLTLSQMQDLGAQLGSDCPFFIRNRPVFAFGRGDQFEPVELDLSGYRIVLVVPPVHVSTLEAYSMVTPRKPEHSLKEVIARPVEAWKDLLTNDFEEPVMKKYPVIHEVKEELYRQGAIYAAMSGSGAAVFGLFSPQSTVGSGQFDPSISVFSTTGELQS